MTATCTACGETKPVSAFYPRKDTKKGHTAQCAACVKERAAKWYRENTARARANRAEWHTKNRERQAAYKRRTVYGLTEDEYAQMLREQDNRCAICRRSRPLEVDHCHGNGHVRGLLCGKCNSALGYLGDDPEVIQRAAQYLLDDRARTQTSLTASAV